MVSSIGDVLKNERKQLLTVNSTVKEININTVNCIPNKPEYEKLEAKTNEILNELKGEPEYLADKLCRELDDQKSRRWYFLLAKNTNPGILLDALSCTLTLHKEGKIYKTKWAYF